MQTRFSCNCQKKDPFKSNEALFNQLKKKLFILVYGGPLMRHYFLPQYCGSSSQTLILAFKAVLSLADYNGRNFVVFCFQF